MDLENLPEPLVDAINKLYLPAGMQLTTKPKREAESEEYGACRFVINEHKIVYRVAKTTNTKIGQFLTTWKRPKPGPYVPLDNSDGQFLVVSVSDGIHQGQFIFDQTILLKERIFSNGATRGKGAFRIYPPWCRPTAKQAITTQNWQNQYFFSIEKDKTPDLSKLKKLFKMDEKI